mgnify:CR=1 FL=1
MSTGDHNPARPTPSDWGTLWEHQQAENRANFLNQHTLTAQMAELAIEYKAGARSLRGIFEEMMTDVMYAVPDNPAIRRVVIRSLFERAEISTV